MPALFWIVLWEPSLIMAYMFAQIILYVCGEKYWLSKGLIKCLPMKESYEK